MLPSLTFAQRRRAVTLVVSLTANTPLAPQRYERQLLARFELGEITLDQMEALLAVCVHQVLYHSRAAGQLTPLELQAILQEARPYNAAHGITGLLLYSERRFVQVLEGPRAVVEELYARIRHDTRHVHVETVRQGPGPRRFADWSMDLGQVTPSQLDMALTAVQMRQAPPIISDPRLQALVQAFT